MTTARRNSLGLSSVLTLALAACGSSGGESATALITASEGGALQIDGTETRVDIPADALAEDTEITISMGHLADFGTAADARDDVLVFSPDGIVLSKPASVTLSPGDPAIEAGQLVSILQYVDGGWYPPEVSSAEVGSGGVVHAAVTLLAPIAIVVKDAPQGPTGSVRGSVFHIYTEEPLEGIGFELRADGQVVGTATSNAEGRFLFDDVGVGVYTVHSTIAPENNCYNDAVDKEATVTEDQTTDISFGFVPGPC